MPDAILASRDLFALTAGMRAAGLDVDAVARAAGLDCAPDALPPREVRPELVAAVWEAAFRVTGDPTIAALIGARVPVGAYRIIDFLGWACPDVGAAFRELARYFRLITDQAEWRIDEAGTSAVVELVSHALETPHRINQMQYALGVTLGRFQQAALGSFAPERLELAMPEPPDTTVHREAFRCPIVYAAARTAVIMSHEVWRLPLAGASPELRAMLAQHAAELLARTDDGGSLARVRAAIRSELPKGPPKLETIAARVAMSARTLQRRLGDAATSFQSLVEDERCEAAKSYLGRADLAVGEVAYLLGYSEPSAFARAFKRWTGMSPRAYREAPAS